VLPALQRETADCIEAVLSSPWLAVPVNRHVLSDDFFASGDAERA